MMRWAGTLAQLAQSHEVSEPLQLKGESKPATSSPSPEVNDSLDNLLKPTGRNLDGMLDRNRPFVIRIRTLTG